MHNVSCWGLQNIVVVFFLLHLNLHYNCNILQFLPDLVLSNTQHCKNTGQEKCECYNYYSTTFYLFRCWSWMFNLIRFMSPNLQIISPRHGWSFFAKRIKYEASKSMFKPIKSFEMKIFVTVIRLSGSNIKSDFL